MSACGRCGNDTWASDLCQRCEREHYEDEMVREEQREADERDARASENAQQGESL